MKYATIIVLGLFGLCYVLPKALVEAPYVQERLRKTATEEVGRRLGVKVEVGAMNLDWLNRVVAEEVRVYDSLDVKLFEAGYLSVGFELLPLLRGRFVLSSVRVFGFEVSLEGGSGGAFAFRLPEGGLQVKTLRLHRGRIRYDVRDAPPTPSRFNTAHLDLREISAHASVQLWRDSVHVQIKKLEGEEASGLQLKKLTLIADAGRDSVRIHQLELRLPHTEVHVPQAVIGWRADSVLGEAPVALQIAPSRLCPQDLAAFVPFFARFDEALAVEGEVGGQLNDISLQGLRVTLGEQFAFGGQLRVKDIAKADSAYVSGRVQWLTVDASLLPEAVARLGSLSFTGEVAGFLHRIEVGGRLTSPAGEVTTALVIGNDKVRGLSVKGKVESEGLRLDKVLAEGNAYGNVRFNLTVDAARPAEGELKGSLRGAIEEAEYSGYTYRHILLSGDFRRNGFRGSVRMDDPNGEVALDGMFREQGQQSAFHFTARVRHLRPDKLLLTDRYASPEVSFALRADFTGNSIDNVQGSVRMDSLDVRTALHAFFLQRLTVSAEGDNTKERRLTVGSDVLNGEVRGAYAFHRLADALAGTLEGQLPSLTGSRRAPRRGSLNDFTFRFAMENTEAMSNTLLLPVAIVEPSLIAGFYDEAGGKFGVEAELPRFRTGKTMMEGGFLTCGNADGAPALDLRAMSYNTRGLRNIFRCTADAANDSINAALHWENNKEQLFQTDIKAAITFGEMAGRDGVSGLRTKIAIADSRLFVGDSAWHIPPTSITLQKGRLDIDNLVMEHGGQYLHLNGVASRDVNDSLLLRLKGVELSHVFDLLDIPVLRFGGQATGAMRINDLYANLKVHTNLEVQDFSFHDAHQGKLNLYSEWSDEQHGILLQGSIYRNDTTWTDVNGYVFPLKPNAGLSLYFNANDMDISFLRFFLDGAVKDLRGRAFGTVHVFGPFHQISVEGQALVKEAGMGVAFLNTDYTFSDSVHMDTAQIRLSNVEVHDRLGNSAKVDFVFAHTFFHDYTFRADIVTDNILVYDQSEKNSPMIYGTAFGGGTTSIRGNKRLIDFDIAMRTRPGTLVKFNFTDNAVASAEGVGLVSFVNRDTLIPAPALVVETPKPAELSAARDGATGPELRTNFLLDVTPDATLELLIDPVAGDRIRGNATGNVQVQYGTRSNVRMYGGLNITEGDYNFSLQQLIRRNFKISEGSAASFNGDPNLATIHINGLYSLTANIGDLDPGLLAEADRANVPVNCVLQLDGLLRTPSVTFDIELPGANKEIERQVRSFIDTEDMMTRQIIYLLVLNKFYTPPYSTTEYRSSDFSAVASSALSGQLSSLLNSFTDKVQIGANIRPTYDGINDSEMEMLLSSQLLNNRLLINGNFGYRNSYTLQRNELVGEIDLEYKLTAGGGLRLKAYNHANDTYRYLKQARNTQGLGLLYKREFNAPSELLRRRRRTY